MEIREVVAAGPGWTQVRAADGNTYTLSGTRNWRNNNPGNLEYRDFAKSKGAVGTDGRFAVFPSYDAGRQAQQSLLFESPKYADKTISGAISQYAPSFENNTQGYYSRIARDAGVTPDTPLSALNEDQRGTLLDSMQRVEGYRPGKVTDAYGNPVSAGLLNSYTPMADIPNVPTPTPAPDIAGILNAPQPVSPQEYAAYSSPLTSVQRSPLKDVDMASAKPNMQTVPDLKYDRFATPFDQSRFADPTQAAAGQNALRRGLLDQQLNAGILPSIDNPAYAAMQQPDPMVTGAAEPASINTAAVQPPAFNAQPSMGQPGGLLSPQEQQAVSAQRAYLDQQPFNKAPAFGGKGKQLGAGILGAVLGGLALGPGGAVLGGLLGPAVTKPGGLFGGQFPEKPQSQSRGNGELTDYGRSVSNQSSQFSRAMASGGKGLY
jgi:hypothetical protein